MKNMLRYMTDRTWFSRLLGHLVRKWSGCISYNLGARTVCITVQ